MRALLPYFFITVRRNNLENISVIEVWNHRVFVNTWTVDYKYPVPDCENLSFLFKSSYLKNKKHFLGFLFHLWNLHQILNNFKKKNIVIANVFPKLATVQGLVTPLTIQRRLKTSFDSQHVKRYQTLVKSSWENFYHIFSSLWGEIIWKISPWLKFEIIGFLLTHGLSITSILFRIVRICRSLFKSSSLKRKKHFLGFLFHLWNLHQISNIFKKKKIVIANVFPKLATVQALVTPLTIQRRLKTSFDFQHDER